MTRVLKFTLYLLISIKISAQKCLNLSQFYDYISQTCIQCHQSCLTCFGSQTDQCLTCNQDHYLYYEENMCTKKCLSSAYQNEITKECINCQILGCQQCKSPQKCIQCSDNFELKDGECYLKENKCNNQQFYDQIQNKCLYSCKENQFENQITKMCQNIQECNQIDQYSDQQIRLQGQIFVLSNFNVVFYQKPCRFNVANLNLQFIYSIELFSNENLTNPLNYLFFQSGDKVACIRKDFIVVYDFLKNEKKEINTKIDSNLQMAQFKVFLESNIAIYSELNNLTILDLQNSQYFTMQNIIECYFQISIRYTMFQITISKQNFKFQTLFVEMNTQKGMVINLTLNEESIFSQILNDDLGIFCSDFLDKMRFYQIVKKDQININFLFEYRYEKNNFQFILQNSNIHFLDKQRLILMIREDKQEKNLLIFQIENNWKSLNLKKKIILTDISNVQQYVLDNRNNKKFLQINVNDQICFIEINEQLSSINEKAIIYDKCIYHKYNKHSFYQSYTLINDNLIYFFFTPNNNNQILLLQSNINFKDNKQDQYKVAEGYSTQFNLLKYNILPIFQGIKQQVLAYYIQFYSDKYSPSYSQQQYIHLYNYQYNKFHRQCLVDLIGLNVNDLSEIFFQRIENNNEKIFIQYKIKQSQYQFMIFNTISFKTILIANITQQNSLPLQIKSQIQYINKYEIILISDYNLLIDLKSQKILNFYGYIKIDFNTPIMIYEKSVQFNYCSEIENKLFVVQNTFFWVELNGLTKSQPQSDQHLEMKKFAHEIQINQDIGLISKEYIFFIQEDLYGDKEYLKYIISYSLISYSFKEQKFVGQQIKFETNAFYLQLKSRKIEVNQIMFKSFDNYLYLLNYEKIQRYSLELNLLETINSKIKLIPRNPYSIIEQRYIIQADSNNFYKFDIKQKKWNILNIRKQINQSTSRTLKGQRNILFFGDKNQYASYENVIINVEQLQIINQVKNTYQLLSITTQKYDINNVSIFFSKDQPYSITVFNFENLPFVQIELCSNAQLINSDYYNYIQFYLCPDDKLIQKLNLLNKSILEYQFDFKFDYKSEFIVIDLSNHLIIFTSNKYELNIYDPLKENSLKIINLKSNKIGEKITKIEICPIQKKAIVQIQYFNMESTDGFDNRLLIIQYIDERLRSIEVYLDILQYDAIKFMTVCEDNLIIVYSPELYSISLDDGKGERNQLNYDVILISQICFNNLYNLFIKILFDLQNDNYIQKEIFYFFKFELTCFPVLDQNNQIQLFIGHYGAIFAKENKRIDFYTQCYFYPLIAYYDQKQQIIMLLAFEINQFMLQSYNVKINTETTYFFDIVFNEKFQYFNEESSELLILDVQFALSKYNYIQNSMNKTQLPYSSLSGFLLDFHRDVIFFYDDRYIYSHRLTDLYFLETIMDEKYYNQNIINVQIDKNLNILTVYKDSNTVLLYDIHEIIYTEDFSLKEKFEINYLEFLNFHYIVYNVETKFLVLFQKSSFRDIVPVKQTDENSFNIGNLIKIGDDKLFYSNLDIIIFCQINTVQSKINKICELYHQIVIQEIFYDQKQNLIIIIEQQTNNFYEFNLFNAEQTNECSFIMKVDNFGKNKYQYGVIQNKILIYYSDDILYLYHLDQKNFKFKQLSTGKISLIEKLNFKINKSSNRREENYLNNERIQNVNDNVLDKLILIIFKEAHKIIIFDSDLLEIKNQVDVNYTILNIYVDIVRDLIFIVGNMGYTYIYTYNIELSKQLRNPCLHQTRILSDEYFIYSFCQKQLDIYNRENLDKVYPTIKLGLQSLHRIIYTRQKDIFILVQYQSLQVVKILLQNNFKILFEVKRELLTVASWQVVIDRNFAKYLQIIAISLLDIVDYKISLDFSEMCQLTFYQRNSNEQNDYYFKNIQKYMSYSPQLLQQIRIIQQNNSQLYLPILQSNKIKNGVNVKYFSDKETNILIWKNEQIFNKSNIKQLELNSINLSTEENNPINITRHNNNIKQILLENIRFINIQQPIIFQNFEEIILNNIVFENIQINNIENVLFFENCQNIMISNLNISNSSFQQQNLIFILNSNIIKIQHTNIINSSFYSLYKIKKSQSSTIDVLYASNIILQGQLIDQIQVVSSKIQNINITNLRGGIILKQNECQSLQLDNIFMDKLNNLRILEVEPIKNILVFENFNLKIKNLQVNKCTQIQLISLNIIYDNVQIEDSSFNNIIRPEQLLNIQTYQLNLNNVTFNSISQNQTSSILKISNFNQINIENSIFQKNQIQLIRILNFNENSQVNLRFNNITVNNNCVASLFEIIGLPNLQIMNSQFNNNCDGVFLVKNMQQLFLENSNFFENMQNNGKGSCLYLEDVEITNIKNSTFMFNTNQKDDGGSIYYKFSKNVEFQKNGLLICEKSKFLNNSAQYGKGGGIFLSNVNLIIKSSVLKENLAAIGGGIYYEKLIPDAIRDQKIQYFNEITDNKSIFYGNNVGSTLRKIQFQPENILNSDYSFIQNNQTNEIEIINFQSGSYLQLNNINFLDEEGNALSLINIQNDLTEDIIKEIENLSISIQNSVNNQQSNSSQIVFQGGLIQKYSQEGFNFNISLLFQLNKQSSFFLSSSNINQLLYSNEKQLSKEQPIQLKLKFLVNFRKCKLGEISRIILDNTICEKCSDGKYSLSLEDTECQICLPESTKKCEGNSITLKQGFWRKSNITDLIIPCSANQFSCQSENPKQINGCIEGYIGPLCESCDYGGDVWNERYSTLLKPYQCAKCSQNILLVFLNGFFFYLFIFVQIQYAVSKIANQIQIYLCSYYLKLSGILFLSKSGNP